MMLRPVLALTFASILAGGEFMPARLRGGSAPRLPVEPVGGGQVLLELSVTPMGRVGGVATLRATSPFTDLLTGAVAGWSFEPAREEREAVESRVLVAGVFRPPALVGPSLGEVPRDVGPPSGGAPFPDSIVPPLYPPRAVGDGAVLVEMDVGADGKVARARIVSSSPPFDASALEAARQWTFRPARRGPAFVYAVFGFRQPATSPTSPAPPTQVSPPRTPSDVSP